MASQLTSHLIATPEWQAPEGVPPRSGPERVAVVVTKRPGVFAETQASLRQVGFDRVIHAKPQALLGGPEVFWVMDLRVEGAMATVKKLVRMGRRRGMVITTGAPTKDIRELVGMGVPSLLVLAQIEAAAPNDPAGTLAPLTAREVQVLQAMAEGLSPLDAGQRLHMSPLTIKSHLGRIARKLDSNNTAHSVMIGLRAGILR